MISVAKGCDWGREIGSLRIFAFFLKKGGQGYEIQQLKLGKGQGSV